MKRKYTAAEVRRMKTFPDTEYFAFHNENPKGKLTCDCVIRAVATVLGVTWKRAYKELVEFAVERGMMFAEKDCYGKFLESKGFTRMKMPKRPDGKRLNFKEAIKQGLFKDKGMIAANAGTYHIVAVVDDMVLDTWNSSLEKVGVWWCQNA